MFEELLTRGERKLWRSLTSPVKIQAFLDTVAYSTQSGYRCPLRVLRERTAHCFDGAMFAAAALRELGHPPRIVYLTAVRDDDHCLAVYRRAGGWGAIAKSNFSGIRFREPVYRSLRELVLSYFEGYFNSRRERTLRGYTRPLDLRRYDSTDWLIADEALEPIADHLDRVRQHSPFTRSMIRNLSVVDELSYRAGLLGCNPKGLYKP